MVSSNALTVSQYLDELSPERREDVEILLQTIRNNIPVGYEEGMAWGMVNFQVPLAVSGPTYNGQPLASAAIASQKNYISVYLLGIYASQELSLEFRDRWARSGKKLDMGKSCIRFKTVEDADLPTIAWAAGLLNPQEFTRMYLAARASRDPKRSELIGE